MIFLILIVIIAVLLIIIYLQNEEVSTSHRIINELRKPQEAPQDQTSQNLIHDAAEKANEIVTAAELESLKFSAEKETELNLFESQYQQKMDNMVSQIFALLSQTVKNVEGGFSSSLIQTEKDHEKFISTVEQHSSEWQNKLETDMSSRVNNLLFNFEQNLANFLSKAEKESLDAINLELRSARQLIDSYKSQQLSLVDENIVAVLERSMNLVLKEKLSLKDQLDLVYEALERAKLEKFLV